MTYQVIDLAGIEEPVEFDTYEEAQEGLLVSKTRFKNFIVNIKTRELFNRIVREDDTKAADSVSDIPVTYAYSVYNHTINQHIGNVFYGLINGNFALIKSVNGRVTEKYLKNVILDGTERYFVTYDKDNKPLEYYTKFDNRVAKYCAITQKYITTTFTEELPEGKVSPPFSLGKVTGWSDKKVGLVIEYIKDIDMSSELYVNTYKQLYSQEYQEVDNRFSIKIKE
jgi:hypothetical protein